MIPSQSAGIPPSSTPVVLIEALVADGAIAEGSLVCLGAGSEFQAQVGGGKKGEKKTMNQSMNQSIDPSFLPSFLPSPGLQR